MAAMFRRQRPGGGRHPPPLAPTVSNFKPRAQWTNSGSSIFLYVNLPGFYMDQIEVKKDERTRTVQIQGQRPLSSQTRARFNETYRVPETCDMTKSETSFAHGLLTIEFPVVVEGKKPEKAVQDQGKIRPNKEEKRGPGLGNLGRKKVSEEEKQVETSQERAAPKVDEPRTYKSVVEGKREKKSEQKVKEGEANPSLGIKERVKEEKVVERKESAQLDQQKTVQKKEDEARSTPKVRGSVKSKVRAKEEKVTERKKDADIGQDKTGQRVKEEEVTRTPNIDGSLDPKVNTNGEKVVERKGDGEKGQKVKEKGKDFLGQKKEEKNTEPVVGDEAKTTEKKTSAINREEAELKTKEKVERIASDEKKEKMAEDKVSEGEIQERVKQKKMEETGLAKEKEDVKENVEAAEPKKVDLDDSMKKESARGSEDREKMVEKSLESETSPLLVEEGQNKIDMDPTVVRRRGLSEEEESKKKYDISLVNVGVAALVIMGFGAYIFVPLIKLFL